VAESIVDFSSLQTGPRVLNSYRRQHAQRVHLIVRFVNALCRVHEPAKAKILRLIHTQRYAQPPRRCVSEGEVGLDVLERIMRQIVLGHDLLPRLVILRIRRPAGERK
jgi:hypothetical protein